MTDQQRALLQLAATQATTKSAQAIGLAYHAADTNAIWDSSPLQRYCRDIHALTQPAIVAHPLSVSEMTDRLMLGLGPGQTPL